MKAAVREHSGPEVRKCGKRLDVSRGSTRMLAYLGLYKTESQPYHEKKGAHVSPLLRVLTHLWFLLPYRSDTTSSLCGLS